MEHGMAVPRRGEQQHLRMFCPHCGRVTECVLLGSTLARCVEAEHALFPIGERAKPTEVERPLRTVVGWAPVHRSPRRQQLHEQQIRGEKPRKGG